MIKLLVERAYLKVGLPVDILPKLDHDDNREKDVVHAWDHDSHRVEDLVCIHRKTGQVVIRVCSHWGVPDILLEDREVLVYNQLVDTLPNHACNLEEEARVRSHWKADSQRDDQRQEEVWNCQKDPRGRCTRLFLSYSAQRAP